MSRDVHRVSDPNTAGGIVSSVLQDFVSCEGQLVAVDGSPVTPHFPFFPPHVGTITASGASWFTINGIPVNAEGDADSCGHARDAGSTIFNLID